MEQNQKGSKAYLISIVMVAVLGGLLFGYDTAVISGAEKGLQAFLRVLMISNTPILCTDSLLQVH